MTNYTPTMRLLVTLDPALADFPVTVTLNRNQASVDAEEVTDPLLADATVIIVDQPSEAVEVVYWVT